MPRSKQLVERKVTAFEIVETAFSKVKDELSDGEARRLSKPDKLFWCRVMRAFVLSKQFYAKPKG